MLGTALPGLGDGIDCTNTLEPRNPRPAQARDPKQPGPRAARSCVRRAEQIWNRPPRAMQSPSVEIFKIQLDTAAANLTWGWK